MTTSILANLTAAAVTVMTTELNSLTNNSLVISSVNGTSGLFDNSIASTGGDALSPGYMYGDVEAVIGAFGTAPSAGSGLAIWFLQTVDGTNYEDGSSSLTPARAPNFFIPFEANTSAQRITMPMVQLPAGKFYVLAQNLSSGQTMKSSGHTIKIRPVTPQGQAA